VDSVLPCSNKKNDVDEDSDDDGNNEIEGLDDGDALDAKTVMEWFFRVLGEKYPEELI